GARLTGEARPAGGREVPDFVQTFTRAYRETETGPVAAQARAWGGFGPRFFRSTGECRAVRTQPLEARASPKRRSRACPCTCGAWTPPPGRASRPAPAKNWRPRRGPTRRNSATLRKDLSELGSYGTRGVGYDVDSLVYQVSRELGLTQDWPVVIVGAGNLGRALANYGGFASRGFRIAAVLDADPTVVGTEIAAGQVVGSSDAIEEVVAERGVSIGVIATPAAAAQGVCDRLVAAGVTS